MDDKAIRIAVCQLESHPALRVADRNLLAEPFSPNDKTPTLAELARHSIDIASLRRDCESQYTEWCGERLRLVLAWLSQLDPPPHVVVFPEGALPPSVLHFARTFAQEYEAVVFAGTHTLCLTQSHSKMYKSLGIARRALKDLDNQPGEALNIQPIFSASQSIIHVKSRPSVFETTEVTRSSASSPTTIQCIDFSSRGIRLSILPLVCAEALHTHNVNGRPDLVAISAYNRSIDPFLPMIQHNNLNKIPVVFCNDGRYGQSAVLSPIDDRMSNWWWAAPINGRLPKGDAVLVVDVDLNNVAPQVGVANPHPALQLASVAAITAEQGDASAARVSGELNDLGARTDVRTQAQLLDDLLARESPSEIQHAKLLQLRRLVENATAAREWWEVLGKDCILKEQGDFDAIESRLARTSVPALEAVLASSLINDDATIGRLHKLVQLCRKATQGDIGGSQQSLPSTQVAPLDRVQETGELRRLLDGKNIRAIILSGLEQIGKQTLVELALSQSGRLHTLVIPLTDDTTPEFLVATLLRFASLPLPEEITGHELESDDFSDRLPRGLVIVLRGAHQLVSFGDWRDPSFPELIRRIADALAKAGGKLIIESIRQLTLDTFSPGELARVPLRGLDDDNGTVLLDQHLRRVGIDPTHFNADDRRLIVATLGGHPGAIILAAEFIFSEGMTTVITDLRVRKGVHARIVRLLLTKCDFAEEELCLLSVLNNIRVPIPAKLLDEIVDCPAVPVAMSLWRASVVDRLRDDEIEISTLLRGFADLPPCDATLLNTLHSVLSDHFGIRASEGIGAEHLRWAAEARYHATLAGCLAFGPDVRQLADGVLGALMQKVRQHDYEGARPLVDGLLKTHRTAEICQQAAVVYARLGDVEPALILAKEALSMDARRTWVLSEVGRLALHIHRSEIAADAVTIVKAAGRDNSYLAVLEGRICIQNDDFDGAIQAFRRGVALSEADGRDAWPFLYLGRELLKGGEVDEAIDVLYRGETLETGQHRLHRNVLVAIRTQLAIAYLIAKELPSAQNYLKLVLDEDPGNPEVARANVFFKAVTGAEDVASSVAKGLDPRRARHRYERSQIHMYRGLFFLNTGNRERASEEFRLAHRADPRNVFVLLRWTETLIELARDLEIDRQFEASRYCAEQAKATAEKVLEFDRDNARARALLEKIADLFNVL